MSKVICACIVRKKIVYYRINGELLQWDGNLYSFIEYMSKEHEKSKVDKIS